MKVFDNYEISPCRRYEEPDSPGRFFFEVCEPHEADVWTLYGHINGKGVEAIGDFPTCKVAEEVFFRITGIRFTGSYQAEAHLRVMHAGPKLLAVMLNLLPLFCEMLDDLDDSDSSESHPLVEASRTVIAEATGRAA